MNATLLNSAYFWRVITHLGSAGLLLLVFAVQALSLWSNHRAVVLKWLLALSLAIALTLASKFLFIGWGIGVVSADFTGISGHTVLATSILPVFFYLLAPPDSKRWRHMGVSIGLLLAVGVGLSRIFLGAHSVSEVLSAWVIGLAVSTFTIRTMGNAIAPPVLARFSPMLLLFAFSTTTSNFLPTHDWEVKFALFLSGHAKPFSRHQFHKQENRKGQLTSGVLSCIHRS